MTVKLINITQNYMELLKTAAGQCHQNEPSDKVIQGIINSRHLSVLEHCSASFELNCSISVLLQLTRHRHFSFTVQSSRACELTDVHETGDMLIDSFVDSSMENYVELIMSGIPYEQAAYLLPKATKYNLVMTGNFRSWFEYLPKRLCKRALPEHNKLAINIHNELSKYAPEIFDRDLMNCKQCKEKSCEFS